MSVIKLSNESLLKSKIEKMNNFEDSFFSDSYRQAYESLEDICKNYNNTDDDYYNNIIAFVGDRGSGKTSTMRSFSHSLKTIDKDNKFQEKIAPNLEFHVLDIIDPSLFSNRDSLVEIIVSNMFRKFKENKNNNDLVKKQGLVKQFEKVFEEIKTVNIDKKSIFHECNDNIERLIGLSAALDLKKDLKDLIELYLGYLSSKRNVERFLVVSIDDIDMNLEVGGYLLEDIRKYLIQNNIILLIAVNFDQLEEIVVQKFVVGLHENFKFQHDVYEQDKKEGYRFLADFKNRIDEKTEKYLDKLIPYNRRCFMPIIDLDSELELMDDCLHNLEYEDDNKRLEDIIILNFQNKLNYKIESENHKRTLIPKNLRSLIQLLILLNSMKNNEIKNNLKQMITYFREILINDVEDRKDQLFLQDILKCYYKDINRKILIYLNTKIRNEIEYTDFELKDIKYDLDYIEKNKTLIFSNRITVGDIITWIKLYDRVQFENKKSRFIETVKSIYTIRLLISYYEYIERNIGKYMSAQEDEEFNIQDIIGKDIIGKYFYVTANKNRDKYIYKINVQKISEDEKIKINDMYPYIVTPRFTLDNRREDFNYYLRLTRREDNSYDTLKDSNRFSYCFLKAFGILQHCVNMNIENLFNIINIDNFMNELDVFDKYFHNLSGSEEEIIVRAIDKLFEDERIIKKVGYHENEEIMKMKEFINENFKKMIFDIDKNLIEEIKGKIEARIRFLNNKGYLEFFPLTTLKNTCSDIMENIKKIGLGKSQISEFNEMFEEHLNNMNALKSTDRVTKTDEIVVRYLDSLKELLKALKELFEPTNNLSY